jgi:hypothetical protein
MVKSAEYRNFHNVVVVRNLVPVSTKNIILPEITRLEAVRSEVDVAICDLGVVTMGSFSVRCRTRPFEGRWCNAQRQSGN